MSKLVAIISFALLASVAFGTPAAGTGTSSLKAVQVFDVTTTADETDWQSGTIPTGGVIFGPGTANTTVWAYGVIYSDSEITGVVARRINATELIAGTETVIGTDAYALTGLTLSSVMGAPVLAVGNGLLAAFTTSYSNYMLSIVLYLWTEGTSGSTTASPITIVTASTADVAYISSTDYNIRNVWYQDDVFYIVYSEVVGSSTNGDTINVYTESNIYLQGYNTTSAAKLYGTAVTVASGLSGTINDYSRTAPSTVAYPIGGPSSYTLPSFIYVLYKSAGTIYGVAVNRTAGTAGSASALSGITDATYDMGSTTGHTYIPVGVWFTESWYGALISNITEASSGDTDAYSLTSCNGTTCADSGFGVLSSATGPVIQAYAYTYESTGYGIVIAYETAESTYSYSELIFNSTGYATTSSATTVGTVEGNANFFLDVDYSLWFGYAVADTVDIGYVYSGYLAEAAYSVVTFGNLLASFFAFLTLLLASLFAF